MNSEPFQRLSLALDKHDISKEEFQRLWDLEVRKQKNY